MKTLKNYTPPSVLRNRLAQLGIKTKLLYFEKKNPTLGVLARCPFHLVFKSGLYVISADVSCDGVSWQYAIYHARPSGDPVLEDKDMLIEDTNLELVLTRFGRHVAKLAKQFARIAEGLK